MIYYYNKFGIFVKKLLFYTFITLFTLLFVGVIVVMSSIKHIQLSHGAILHVLPAWKNNQFQGAVIICPGGGYSSLSTWHEGYWWFPFFYMRGFVPALLEYRMPNHDYHAPMTDGAEAIKMMRRHAKELNFDGKNVGIMGFSAGGHLASSMIVIDIDSVRPNFGILFYPVVSMKKELTHMDTHDQLLGKNASDELESQFSNELHISNKTPPTFLAHSSDDMGVSPQNSICFHDGMRAHNRQVALHLYSSGGHGWGYRLTFDHHRQMLKDLSDWLNTMKNK